MKASLVYGLAGLRSWAAARGLVKRKSRAARLVLRGLSRRAYSFQVFARDEVAALAEVGAVYIYARTLPTHPQAAAGNGVEFGYIGRTADLARRDAEHERLAHFAGHGFDTVLVLPIAEEAIRLDIESDLIALYRPLLNDLLRGDQPADHS